MWFLLWIIILLWPASAKAQVLINEFLPNPDDSRDEGEWIELYNSGSDEVSLDGWSLDDQEGGSKPFLLDGMTITGNNFLVIEKALSKISLNNDGDEVRLFSHQGITDLYAYEKTTEGMVYYRTPDGNNWQEGASATPGNANSQNTSSLPTAAIGNFIARADELSFIELYPCPTKDEKEWVTIYFKGSETKSFNGWKIVDEAGNSYDIDGLIEKTSTRTITIDKAMMNNGGDTIGLQSPDGINSGNTTYPACPENTSWVYDNGQWRWKSDRTSALPTEVNSKPTEVSKDVNEEIQPTDVQPTLNIKTGKEENNGENVASVAGQLTFESVNSAPIASDSSTPEIQDQPAKPPLFLFAGLALFLAGSWPLLKKTSSR